MALQAEAQAMERRGTIDIPADLESGVVPAEHAPHRLGRVGAAWRIARSVIARRPANTATEIRITRLCSQRCRQCAIPIGAVPADTMPLDAFRALAAKIRNYGAGAGFISGGEPTLHPQLPEILEEAVRTFPLACTLNTNLDNSAEVIRERVGCALRLGVNVQTSIDGLGDLGDNLRGGDQVAERVLRQMAELREMKEQLGSRSILYCNTVLNGLNLDDVARISERVRAVGWKSSIGSYHDLTLHTRRDNPLFLEKTEKLQNLIDRLLTTPDVVTLPAMLRGIPRHAAGEEAKRCAYTEAPSLASRILIRENGDVYLCKGKPIGNALRDPLASILSGEIYHRRLEEYDSCPGCWNNCYTQKLLLIKPGSLRGAWENFRFASGLGRARGRARARAPQ